MESPAPKVLTYITSKTNPLGLIALLIAAYFAGSFIQGERIQTRELKAELAEIEKRHAEIMAEVDSINSITAQKDLFLQSKIAQTYQKLDNYGEQIAARRAALKRRSWAISQQGKKNREDAKQMQNAGGFKFKKQGGR